MPNTTPCLQKNYYGVPAVPSEAAAKAQADLEAVKQKELAAYKAAELKRIQEEEVKREALRSGAVNNDPRKQAPAAQGSQQTPRNTIVLEIPQECGEGFSCFNKGAMTKAIQEEGAV